MTTKEHEERTDKWNKRTAIDLFRTKSPYEDIPIWMGLGSSSHNPERKGGITTCDIVLWCKFGDTEWFRPYGRFSQEQIREMVGVCSNDSQVKSLIKMLMSKMG